MKKIISFFIIIGIFFFHSCAQTMAFSVQNNIHNENNNCCSEKDNKSCNTKECCINSTEIVEYANLGNFFKIEVQKYTIKNNYFKLFSLYQNNHIIQNILKIIPPNKYILKKYNEVYLVGIIKLNI